VLCYYPFLYVIGVATLITYENDLKNGVFYPEALLYIYKKASFFAYYFLHSPLNVWQLACPKQERNSHPLWGRGLIFLFPMTLLGPFTELLTLQNLPMRGALQDEQIEIIPDAGVLYNADGIIMAVGKFLEMKKDALIQGYAIETITESLVLLPGLIDCHTHTCYAGNRAQDFAMRMAGKAYLAIAKAGGGIMHTVRATREASLETLKALTRTRLLRHKKEGITTCEIKSGYGLSFEAELKMLQVIADLQQEDTGIDLIPTCLAAHICPPEFENQKAYITHLITMLLPEVKKRNLSHRIDIFVEETAFDAENARYYLEEAQKMGFALTLHADQFHAFGSKLAVEMNAQSADHLENSTEEAIEYLAQSNTVAVALPGASIGVGDKFTPARKLLDAGAILAIATDLNPGSAPMGNLLLQASILAMYEKLSTAEVFAAITFRAAYALGLQDRGTIEVGKRADFVTFKTTDYKNILYQAATTEHIHGTWLKGVKTF